MVLNRAQYSLQELAERASKAAIKANEDSLNYEEKQQALLEKQIALTELMSVLMEQIKVDLPKPKTTDSSIYIYEEAIQELFLYICKNIHKYNPEIGPIMGWVVFILKRRKINAFRQLNWNGKVISIYREGDESETNILDIYCPPDIKEPLPSENLIAFIKEDPEGLLASTLFNKNPKASFQAILLKKGEEDKTWKEIVQELELGPTHGPVYRFYGRCCEKFAPYFKKYLCE